MRKMQLFIAMLALLLAGYSGTLRADDTDIYVDNSGTTGIPNILFVLDNGADFSSSAPACNYAAGGTATLSGSTGGVEQCALVDAINSLPDTGAVNIGIMIGNASGIASDVRATGDAAYHEACVGQYGGCLVRKLTKMDAAGKASMSNFIKSWVTAGQNSATQFNVKGANNGRTAQSMQEAWAYLNGKTGMSGKTYSDNILQSGCQRNFVVFIANAYTVNGTPADGGTDSPGSPGALDAAQVGASTAQKAKISESVTFAPPSCGTTTINAGTNANDWSNNWADEWARLMFQQDGGTADMQGQQNIITYTIGVINDAKCVPDYPALLTTMAKFGGGKYFKAANSSDLAAAIGQILNEVQAVNSVFSSASLPVSVNAQGTYLNQIFLGMFRPDGDGLPRWMGNLKQYQLITGTGGNLVMGDAQNPPQPAISSAGTGFLSPTAVSFWTYKHIATAPDDPVTGGFFSKDPKGTPASGYDSADGEVVEKGGVAQQLRKENLKATFAGAMASGTNPRRLYTYCPSSSGCKPDLTDATNEFSTANSGIDPAAFGSSVSVPITSIQRTGTTALVTTAGNHGFKVGNAVTVLNANQGAYNVTQTLTSTTLNSSNTFTITGLPDTPKTPALGTYVVAKPGAASFGVSSLYRTACTTSGCATTSDTGTAVTSSAHTFVVGNTVQFSSTISGYPSQVAVSAVSTSSFTFTVPLSPGIASAAGTAGYATDGSTVISSMSAAGGLITVNASAHPFHTSQTVTITGSNALDGSYVITKISGTQFSFASTVTDTSAKKKNTAMTATRSATAQGVTLQRMDNAAAATVQVTGAPANFFASGDTVTIGSTTTPALAPSSGSAVISCTGTCTSFTYTVPLPATPAPLPTGFQANIGGLPYTATSVSRNTSGTVTMVMPINTFVTGDNVNVTAQNGTGYTDESEYLGSYTITCTVNPGCTTLTYGPIALNPLTPATGTNMAAYSPSASPDRDTVIKWVRGQDNQGDEKSPGNGITVRGSVHGDVLHSRPLVINYGDTRGIVAYYGANDGVFRAVNGNQAGNIGTIPPGGEIWGLVVPEHYPYLNRLRTNSPELKFPSTILATAQPKNYFVDGPTGVYQKLGTNGTIETAYIYLTMRRGGRLIYALDVSQPQQPKVLWTHDNTDAGFAELGQTWSRPRLTLLQNYANPVLVFGGGYGPSQDNEPPTVASTGRAIFIIDAVSGALVWSATPTCTTSSTCLQVPGLTHPIPSDVTFVDRNNDGKIDKLYVGDLGGNVWRFDVSDASTSNWTATKIASLGCDDGSSPAPLCPAQTMTVNGATVTAQPAPRKFFFPPSVLTVKATGATGSYDAISIASGDREHPLKNATLASSSYYVTDRFFMIKDTGTVVGTPVTTNVKLSNLFNATSTAWDGTGSGFYLTFATGEKAVNAPLAVNGTVFFATNKPIDSTAQCAANLGQARAYGVDPFTGVAVSNVLQGGGMPPSAVSGVVQLTRTNADGSKTNYTEKFCIGCGISGSQLGGTNTNNCNSALENCNVGKVIPKNLRRTYWYKK